MPTSNFGAIRDHLSQRCPTELSRMMEIYSVLPKMVATSHMWLLSTRNVASVAEELSFKCHLILNKI